jgi:putative pyruvate formate lyase activating enzyme
MIVDQRPAYMQLYATGALEERVELAHQRLAKCDICAHTCHVDRLAGELGTCNTGAKARVSSFAPHFGEEDPLRGMDGSGTIFFSRCNLRCQYCQNHVISQKNAGHESSAKDLAAIMLRLQAMGCHNINFVSPSHVVPQILAGVLIAAQAGLHIPLVYNTGGYDSLETLALLDGVIDIYMPDIKYVDPQLAEKYSQISDYPQVNQAAIKEMHRQVGDLKLRPPGIAWRGLLVRHLILPDNLAGTDQAVRFLAQEISPNTYLNLMDQYRPEYRAHHYPELNRRILQSEFEAAVELALEAGLTRLDKRNTARDII